MKKFGALLILSAAMLVAVPAFNNAWAAPRGNYAGQDAGWQHPAISPEKQGAYEKIILDYHSKAQPLQNDLWAKQTELDYLGRDADAKNVNKLVNDIKVAREKMQSLSDSTAAKMAKDLGISMPHAYSLLRDCGMGGGNGYGYHRGGGYHNGPRGYHGGGHRGYYDGPRGDYYDGPRGGYHGGGHRGYHRGY